LIVELLEHAPNLDPEAAAALALALFGIEAEAVPLASERDQNFRLHSTHGERFVLKIANALESRDLLEAQNAAMEAVARGGGLAPRIMRSRDGHTIVATQVGGVTHLVRLLSWVPGVPLGDVRRQSSALHADLGQRLGELDRALAGFDHPAIHREFHWDIARGFDVVASHVARINDPDWRGFIERTVARLERDLGPRLPSLRKGAVHNDPNDYNVIVASAGHAWGRGQRISGFIDFGDMVHSLVVSDPVVAASYAALDKVDPLSVVRTIVSGYHSVFPLTDDDIGAVWGLLQLRLSMSVCLAAWQQSQRPDDEYLTISQGAIRRSLPAIAAVPPRFAEVALRASCGLDAVAASARVTSWLSAQSFAPVVQGSTAAVIDLSVSSALVSGDSAMNAEPLLTRRVEDAMARAAAVIGVGRYGEPRILYTSPLFDGAERRTIHLGIDLFAPEGTPVHAALDGIVHLAVDNDAPLDYGPVIVLEHRTPDGDPFYTLYGHLTRESLDSTRAGSHVTAGQRIAAIGGAGVNGGWTPHLHFQLITDLLDLGRDFPGVCRASEREVWRAISPDPNVILRLDGASYPEEVLNVSDTSARRRRATGSNVSVGYRQPVAVARGWMEYLFDRTGRRYLDAYNNVPHVGHSHPAVVRAVAEQLSVLNTNTRYLHDSLAMLSERLSATLPAPLSVCYFVNSGSEANELALRMARAYTRARDLIVLDAAYHGNTTTLIEISPYKFNGPGGSGRPDWVQVAALPDTFRGRYKGPDSAAPYAGDVDVAIGRLRAAGRSLCGFIAETCPSVGGQIVLPAGYLSRVYDAVRAAGGVCIADEVQTAYGRMGTHFYAFQAHDVVPDIVVLGKPIGNGYPLGAVVTSAEIAWAFDNGMEFFSTFGGSTASCAAGLAVLDVVEREHLQAHALRVGAHLL
jgi:4-aminobutyrate aminotransferase-like enzyme/Ser/Thr protein kinase RdoA (MazF antagonist)